MVDGMINKVVGWVDQVVIFVKQYSSLLVWGILAMMVAKFMKVKLNVNTGKK